MKVLYIGPDSGTCRQRAEALRRIGHEVEIIDPFGKLPSWSLLHKWSFKTGGFLLSALLTQAVRRHSAQKMYDLVWVDGGELVSPWLVRRLRDKFGTVVNYNHDDPFGGRDGLRWRLYLKCVPEYDLLIVARDCNVEEARKFGARNVKRIFFGADEIAHRPRALTGSDRERWGSKVAFVGTWMPERGPFLAALVKEGVPLSIYGDRWERAPEWPTLRPFWRGPGVYDSEEYARVIQSAEICIGLLSKGNRDEHTTRSIEIPYLGTLLLAERTKEHLELYEEGKEAEFWSDARECAAKCRALLEDEGKRERIAAAGQARCVANKHLNEVTLSEILHEYFDGEMA